MNEKRPLIDVRTAVMVAGAFLGAKISPVFAAAGALAGSLVSDRMIKPGEESPPFDSTHESTDLSNPAASGESGEKCNSCGRLNKKGSFYCVHCGKRMEEEEVE